MTREERRHLKAQLIQAGLWNADEPNDPTRDEEAAKRLERCVAEKTGLRFSVLSVAYAGGGVSPMNGIAIYRGDELLLRVTGNNYPETICFAAVAVAGLPREKGDQ